MSTTIVRAQTDSCIEECRDDNPRAASGIWRSLQLRDFISLQRGHDLPEHQRREGTVPVMGAAGRNGYHDTALIKGPGVTLGRSGASFGQAHYCTEDFWPHNTALYVTNFKGNDPLFVYYFLDALDLSRYNSGGAQPSLNRNFIYPIRISVPVPDEQRAIAEALSDVDALIGALDKFIAKKRALKLAGMQQLLAGKTRLPGFSEPWSTKRLGDVAAIKTGKKNNQDKVQDGLYPFFVRSQTVERINTFSFDGEAILVPGEGGIGTIIHYVKGKFDYHQRVYKISNFSPDCCGRFIYYAMSYLFDRHASRNTVKATVDSLRLPTFKSFEFPAPPALEQRAIARVLSDMDVEIAVLERRRDKTKDIKLGIMQELLSGRVRLVKSEAAA